MENGLLFPVMKSISLKNPVLHHVGHHILYQNKKGNDAALKRSNKVIFNTDRQEMGTDLEKYRIIQVLT